MRLGIDNFISRKKRYAGLKLGVLVNQASVDSRLRFTPDRLDEAKFRVTTLFGPQHGVWMSEQANMIETRHGRDRKSGKKVYSLYGKTRKPDSRMLKDIDAFVFDLQDIGARVYTYIYTMALTMEACRKNGKKIIILDRPNPVNGVTLEGNILEGNFTSFVGMYPIPMRHGCTVGELAMMFNEEFDIGADLEVVKMTGWERSSYLDEMDYHFVLTSPNIPTVDSCMCYPCTVIFEGTNISEGRGTTKPFEFVGSPFMEPEKVIRRVTREIRDGFVLRPCSFRPTFDKWAGKTCHGFQVHVTNRKTFRPYLLGLTIVKTLIALYPDMFRFIPPPYEYEYKKLPFDIICGTDKIRKLLMKGYPLKGLTGLFSSSGLDAFRKKRKKYLLY